MKGQLTVRTSGVVITTPHDGGPATIQDTIQCCHCQRHRVYVPLSKTLWGYCMNCAAVHCATAECAKCVPAERGLEAIERGVHPDQLPVVSYPLTAAAPPASSLKTEN